MNTEASQEEKAATTGAAKQAVSYEVARAEVEKWLDHKRINTKKREDLKAMIDNIVEGICEGVLSLTPDFEWKHDLVFPLEDNTGRVQLTQLTYKSRISAAQVATFKRHVKGEDMESLLTRNILALTNQPLGFINLLDSSTDRPYAEAIAIFFV